MFKLAAGLAALGLVACFQQPEAYRVLEFSPEIELTHVRSAKKFGDAKLTAANNATSQESIALNFINHNVEVNVGEWKVTNSYNTKHNGLLHMYAQQVVNGLPISNARANVNVNKKGEVLNVGHTAFRPTAVNQIPSVTPKFDAAQALQAYAKFASLSDQPELAAIQKTAGGYTLGATSYALEGMTASLAYVMVDTERLALAWQIGLIMTKDQEHALTAFVDANTLKAVMVHENLFFSTYQVYAPPDLDPLLGSRVLLRDPEPSDDGAGPLGWNKQRDGIEFTDTRGNNVYAQENLKGGSSWENNERPDGGAGLNFDFPVDFGKQPVDYLDASTSNLFYWNNRMHDIFYYRGYDEPAGNFQENNLARGGKENDAVQANSQDGAGRNNANMLTPTDGNRPRMRMYVWDRTNPMRDGDLDSGIIVHEWAHGISNRLTGGPDSSGCLPSGQPGGMGEGWGDWFATIFSTKAADDRDDSFPMGAYAATSGIRPFPYSGNVENNPQTFDYITRSGYSGVHAKGSVWCQTLFETYWQMREVDGFSPDWDRGNAGNNKLLQAVVDGMKIQPCRPQFLDARDAILEAAEENGYGEEIWCAIWRGFAAKGMGPAAESTGNTVYEDYEVPTECAKFKKAQIAV